MGDHLEGYLPNAEFGAQLELLRLAQHSDKESEAGALARVGPQVRPPSQGARRGSGRTALGQTAARFKTRYPESIWAKRASP